MRGFMPNVNITLPDTTQSVLRPVIIDIVSQVQRITKINSDTKIFFPGDSETMRTQGSNIGSESKDARFENDRYNFIEVTEDYNLDTLGVNSLDGTDHLPYFDDSHLKVQLSPIYASSDVVINFKYRCPSKTEAMRWRDDMRLKVSYMRDINIHTVSYHYLLSPELVKLLKAIHERREAYLGYGQSFEEYFASHTRQDVRLISDTAGVDPRLAISESQCKILGLYDFDSVPEKPERDDGTGTWTISFAYRFTYEKPVATNMRYPIMVHNQLLPIEYTYFNNKTYNLDMVNKRYSQQLHGLSKFDADAVMNSMLDPTHVIRLPSFDDFILPSLPGGLGSVFTALCEVDNTDKRTLVNLKELGDIELDEDLIKFIQEVEYPYITKLFRSPIHVTLYRDNGAAEPSVLACDINLNIKSIFDLNLRQQHRIRFSLMTDFSYLDKASIDRLRKYPKAFVKIISACNEILKNNRDFVNLGDKTLISYTDFSSVYAVLTGYRYQQDGTLIQANDWPYLKNGTNYYSGQPVRDMGNTVARNKVSYLFKDLDPRVLDNYRNNMLQRKTVMSTGIVGLSK